MVKNYTAFPFKRDNSFDVCKALLIFLMIIGHYFQGSLNAAGASSVTINRLEYFIYSFHMPAFMFISGWFCYGKEYSFLKYVRNTVVYLCLPLIIWDATINVIDYCSGKFNGLNSLLTSLWYIKSLILIRLMAYPFINRPNIKSCAFFLLLGFIFGQYYLLALLIPSFILGYFSNAFSLLSNKYFVVASLTVYFFELFIVHPSEAISGLALIRHMDFSYWINYLNRLILGLSGTISFIAIVRSWVKTNNSTILNIGKATFGIYIIQAIIVERLISPVVSSYGNVILYIVLSFISLGVSYLFVILLKKIISSEYIIGR